MGTPLYHNRSADYVALPGIILLHMIRDGIQQLVGTVPLRVSLHFFLFSSIETLFF